MAHWKDLWSMLIICRGCEFVRNFDEAESQVRGWTKNWKSEMSTDTVSNQRHLLTPEYRVAQPFWLPNIVIITSLTWISRSVEPSWHPNIVITAPKHRTAEHYLSSLFWMDCNISYFIHSAYTGSIICWTDILFLGNGQNPTLFGVQL
jgi:hypothetical protein